MRDKILSILIYLIVVFIILIVYTFVDKEVLQNAVIIAAVIINPSKIKEYLT